jgi:RNA recognition motif-containing protein
LDFKTTASEIQRLFAEAGEVVDVFLPTDRATGRPRGFAFVEFADGPAAASATQRFDGYELNGRNLRVNEAQERTPRIPSFLDSGAPFGMPPRKIKSKGSRRNLRARKRSL